MGAATAGGAARPRRSAAPRLLALVLLAACSGGCAFHTTARAWNARQGPDGVPVFFTSTTKVGLNLFVVLPILGNTAVDGMVEEITEEIAVQGGDHVRIVQGDSENYWYGFPPLTWILTPVVSTVAADFRPSPTGLQDAWREWAGLPEEEEEKEEEAGE